MGKVISHSSVETGHHLSVFDIVALSIRLVLLSTDEIMTNAVEFQNDGMQESKVKFVK
jgi:hypothetical protein